MEDIRMELLKLIEKYDNCGRDVVAYRIHEIMSPLHLGVVKESRWLIENITKDQYAYDTIRSWFASNRDSKFPLKFLIQLAMYFDVPIETFLQKPSEKIDLRYNKARPNYEASVAAYIREFPEATIENIANDLHITTNTVRRHLKHISS